jgi:LCP family protein required for cell wall assembly
VRRALRIASIAVGVLVLLAAAAAGILYWQARSILDELQAGAKGAEVRAAAPELAKAPHDPVVAPSVEQAHGAQTFLLIGSDHRWTGQNGARSDTVILLRIDANRHRVALLSIPRDLYVAIDGYGHDRINEAYHHGGARLLIRTVREQLGVKIDHFVEVNFAGFRELVRKLGGVWLPVDQRYFNRNLGTVATNYASIDLRPGYQLLDGDEALAFARYRHDDSDLYRAARQQLFLRETIRQVLAARYHPLELRDLARTFARATASDLRSLSQVWWIYRAVRGVSPGRFVRLTLPTSDEVIFGADYLASTRTQERSALARWYGAVRARPQARVVTARARPRPRPQPLLADGGAARALLRGQAAIRRCVPTALPPGYMWPQAAARSYALAGHPAIALYATAGSGRSVLWMWTTWSGPPALDSPSAHVGRFDVWSDSGRIRQIAWRVGPTRAWITNTLRNELSSAQMLALARSCR